MVERGPHLIVFKPSVEKDLQRLPSTLRRRILERIEDLAREPLPRDALKLTGADRLYRIRSGDYRVIYELDRSARTVTVYYVRHRSSAYEHH